MKKISIIILFLFSQQSFSGFCQGVYSSQYFAAQACRAVDRRCFDRYNDPVNNDCPTVNYAYISSNAPGSGGIFGKQWGYNATAGCVDQEDPIDGQCFPPGHTKPTKTKGQPKQCVGNPVDPATGNKFQLETDINSSNSGLGFSRYYNSIGEDPAGALMISGTWTFDYFQRLQTTIYSPLVTVFRPDGKELLFSCPTFAGACMGDKDLNFTLEKFGTNSGYNLITEDSTLEVYSSGGALLSFTPTSGETQTLSYNGSFLDTVTDPYGRALTFSYDASNRLETVTDPDGMVFTYTYDVNGNLASVIYPDETPANNTDNPARQYQYNDPNFDSLLTGIIDENGNLFAEFGYDTQGRAIFSEHSNGAERVDLTYNADGTTTVTDSLGASNGFTFDIVSFVPKTTAIAGGQCGSGCSAQGSAQTYDANGFLASRTDFEGNLTTFINNARGLQESRTEAAGTPEERTITAEWHSTLRLPTKITEPGKETTFTYNTTGQVLTRTQSDLSTSYSRTTSFTYDANGNVLTIDGPRTDVTDVTTFTYDAMGNRATMTVDPDGAGAAPAQVTQFTSYDNNGRLLSMTDPNGIVTTMTYDARGRLLTRTVAAGLGSAATTTFEYDGVGNVTKIILPSNNELNYSYDAAQRLTRVTDRQGHYIQYTLDNLGNRTKEEVFQNNGTLRRTQTRVFDQLSRMIQSVGGVNQLTVFGYDGNGNQISVLDPLNRNSTSEYDGLQRLIKQTDPDINDTLYAYDARDNLTNVTDPRGLTTVYTYNGLDDLTQLDSPDTGITSYTYDDAGNRTSQTNARGIVTNYTYDALNRLTLIEYPGAPGLNVDFLYDTGTNRIGRLYQMKDNTGNTTYNYNKRGDVTRVFKNSQGATYETKYAYDKAGNITKITYPSGKEIQYVYNSIKRVKEVNLINGATTTTLANGIVYRQFGPMQKLIYGNGLTNTIGYDLDYRAKNNRVLPVQDLRIFYDAANNITKINNIVETSKHQDFTYDNLDRLTSADGVYGLLNYTYDAVGNRLTKTDATNTDTHAYQAARNRIRDITDSALVLTDYNHNATGSVTKINTDTFAYNRYERMSKATIGGVETTYRYDGQGQRTVKTNALGGKTLYHFDENGLLIAETKADGITIREYVYLNGQPLAMLEGGNIYYYHIDHLGTPQMMTDATQTIVWQADYNPFGAATLAVNTITNNIRYPGQYFDTESGLHYNYFRDYNPNDGRYMQSDPIGIEGGYNTYAYVLSNPLYWVDPLGLVNQNPSTVGFGGAGPGNITTGGASRGGGTSGLGGVSRGVAPRGGKSSPTKISNGPKFPNLKDHASRHSNLHPNAYYNQAVRNIQEGKRINIRTKKEQRSCRITRTGPDEFLFTSTNKSETVIFTNLRVNGQYLRNKGITLPGNF